MNEWQLGSLVAGLVLGLTFGAGAVALWAEKRRRAWRAFAQRAEQARQHLLQQNTQARKQVEQVRVELKAARHQMALYLAQAGQSRFHDTDSPVVAPEASSPIIGFMQTELERSPDGFASTQIVLRAH